MIKRSTELNLVRRARLGDGKAIEGLIRAHQDALYSFMLRMSGRPDVAEDIVQEAFVRVLRNLDRFDSRFRFSTWVFTIAKRLYVNSVQKLKPVYDSEVVGAARGSSHTPGSISATDETMNNARVLIDEAIEDLNPQQREIILLFHQQDWGIAEIADHLSMPEGTVKSHLHRARRRMRSFLESNHVRYEQVLEVWS